MQEVTREERTANESFFKSILDDDRQEQSPIEEQLGHKTLADVETVRTPLDC
jgi:hypothetical protein